MGNSSSTSRKKRSGPEFSPEEILETALALRELRKLQGRPLPQSIQDLLAAAEATSETPESEPKPPSR